MTRRGIRKWPVILKSKIMGTGSYLPSKRETVTDFLGKGASQEIIDNWGVYEHRVMGDHETVTDMEEKAAKKAMDRAGIKPENINLIISSSTMPRQIGVPNSNALQHKIGAKNAAAFDVSLACASAIPQIMVAAQFISLEQYRYVLITGSCHVTRTADPTDPASFIVLGDGAGAMVMGPAEEEQGILSFDIQTKGEFFNYCGARIKKPKYSTKESQYYDASNEKLHFYIGDFEDKSSGVAKYLVTSVPATVKNALKKAGTAPDDVDWVVTHQNIRPLVDNWLKLMGIPQKKALLTYSKYGNMTNANIFINLDEALQNNKIDKGDIVLFAGQGAGFSVGSIVMRW